MRKSPVRPECRILTVLSGEFGVPAVELIHAVAEAGALIDGKEFNILHFGALGEARFVKNGDNSVTLCHSLKVEVFIGQRRCFKFLFVQSYMFSFTSNRDRLTLFLMANSLKRLFL